MRKKNKRTKIFKVIGILAFVFLLLVFFALQIEMSKNDEEIKEYFKNANISAQIYYLPFEGDSIRVVESGAGEGKPKLVFIHGAPGSCDAFLPYQKMPEMVEKWHMINYDRPGYGFSTPIVPFPTLAKQAEALAEVLKPYQHERLILLSHSFGGPIGQKLVSENGISVAAHLMLNPVVSPSDERMFWFSSIPANKYLRWAFGNGLISASFEKIVHAEELETLLHTWNTCYTQNRVLIGAKDWLAPPKNGDFLKKMMPVSCLDLEVLPNESHFIPFVNRALVIKELDYLLL